MSAIDFVVRSPVGAVRRGSVGDEAQGFLVDAGTGNDISLNISQDDLRGYDRAANDLLITLADGRVIVLEGYFEDGGNRLFLSSNGQLNQVTFVEADGGALFAQYGPTEFAGKWSPDDALIFLDDPAVVAEAAYGDDQVSMLGTALLGATGLGAAGAGLAGLGGLAWLGGGSGGSGGNGGGGGGESWTPPTVDNADGELAVGGGDDRTITVTGTAETGSTVEITIDGTTLTGTSEDGTWSVVFEGDDFPGDGDHGDLTVIVTDPDGTVRDLDGPSIVVDFTPPELGIDSGTVSTGDLFNAEGHAGGVTISGHAEVGSSVTVSMGGQAETVIVGGDGSWSFTVDDGVLPGGEYLADLTVTASDRFGNTTTVTDAIDIDTIPHPLTIDDVTGDGVVNLAEAEGGFAITGGSTPGAVVTVSFGNLTQDVTVGPDGRWSLSVTQADFAGGEYAAQVTVSTVDRSGNVSTAMSAVQVDTVNAVSLDNAPLTGDDVIAGAERDAGVTLSGTTQPGSSVDVTIEGVTRSATVSASGAWSVTFAAADIATGTYEATASIVSTDSAGNGVTTSHAFAVDTEGAITIDTAGVEGDGIVNAAERADGVVLNGTGEPGSDVAVTVAGSVIDTTVGATGAWSVTIPAGLVPEGVTGLAVSATATDAAGNRATASGTIAIDTQTSVTLTPTGAGGDGVVNAMEHAGGVTLTGWAEPGATVAVTLGQITHQAVVQANGSWSAAFIPAEIPAGERILPVTAIATDRAGNSATTTGTLDVDTLVTNFTQTGQPGGVDGVLNAAEAAQGLTLTGTTEIGSTVAVTFGGVTRAATVAADGTWSVTYAAGELPSGERTVTMSATARDAAGNTETLTQEVRIDTDAGLLTISANPVEGDDVVNAAEAADGVTLLGTSTPGQWVDVTMNGVTLTVQTDATGTWRAPYQAFQVAPGTYTAQISASITDSAGNTLVRTDSVRVDTEVVNFGISPDPVTADNVINAAERLQGVTLAGSTEPGGSVTVVVGGVSREATVTADGGWSVQLGAGELPQGETIAQAQVLTTDAAGNTAQTSILLNIDTEVRVLALSGAPIAGDGIVNAAEAMAGVTLTGVVEPGSTVMLAVGGQSIAASVAANGGWTAQIPPSAIPGGTGGLPVTITATDAAGNTATLTEMVAMDTDAPETLSWVGYGRDGGGVDQIRTGITDDAVYLGRLAGTDANPMILDVALADSTDIPILGQTYHTPVSTIPDGTHLVLASTDAAGNSSGAYLVTDDPATNAVRMSDQIAQALGEFDVDTIDLHFAEDSSLTITEAQIVALSSITDTVTVMGGNDDIVTIRGAQAQGSNGAGYNVFTLGDATLLIDDDITQVHTGVV
ncbi:Ig-like domain-containing protein [Thetidibacter halocola]|uniref:Ig-like domain (Group 3) n=1 Tax=Thetidibacter halocola TaxID=2827239 RepID=A0A8J7WDI2_9RHOB|nr:Ig-like domain-containing protein [Thetidibacter halocola]MBS0125602.1 hypothetical protein [Thetidibacter halocola]